MVQRLTMLGVQGHMFHEPWARSCAEQCSAPVVKERFCLAIAEADEELVPAPLRLMKAAK